MRRLMQITTVAVVVTAVLVPAAHAAVKQPVRNQGANAFAPQPEQATLTYKLKDCIISS